MRIKSARYVACHEAGHAIVAVNNGYHPHCIRLSCCLSTGDWNGTTDYFPEPWKCLICEMEVSSRHDPTELQQLKDECPSCSAEKWRFVERCLAGGAATSVLTAAEHVEDDSDCDRVQVGRVYPTRSTERDAAFREGRERAKAKVDRFKPAVAHLMEYLEQSSRFRNEVELSGPEISVALAKFMPELRVDRAPDNGG